MAKKSRRQLHLRLREMNVPGSSLDSVYAYFDEEEREPPIAFLRATALILGVREAWLILGQGGPTASEDAIRQAEVALLSATAQPRLLAEHVPELLKWPRAAQA